MLFCFVVCSESW